MSSDFVSTWRGRFAESGLRGLMDRPRSGHPLKFSPVQRLEIVATMCEPGVPPEGLNGWTYELLCEKLKGDGIADISRSHLCRILARAELRPHKTKMWLHSKDPKFKEKVADIVDLYLNPPVGATVVCFDEKTGMQAIERKYPDKPATPAIPGPVLLGSGALVPAVAPTECPTTFEGALNIEPAVAVVQPVNASEFVPPVQPGAVGESSPAVEPVCTMEPTPPVEPTTVSDSMPIFEALVATESTPAIVETVSVIESSPAAEPVNATGSTPSNAPAATADLTTSAKASAAAMPRKPRKPDKPGTPGKPGKREYEYIRHGTLSLLAAFIVHTGEVLAQMGPTRKAEDLVAFMEYLAATIKGEIHVIWDNLNIHHGERWEKFNKEHGNRFHFHYTPIHASWVNQVEMWFGILQRRCLKNGNFTSTDDLRRQVEAFIALWDTKYKHPFKWSFTGYLPIPRSVEPPRVGGKEAAAK